MKLFTLDWPKTAGFSIDLSMLFQFIFDRFWNMKKKKKDLNGDRIVGCYTYSYWFEISRRCFPCKVILISKFDRIRLHFSHLAIKQFFVLSVIRWEDVINWQNTLMSGLYILESPVKKCEIKTDFIRFQSDFSAPKSKL